MVLPDFSRVQKNLRHVRSDDPVISVQGLSYSYGDVPALSEVSLTIRKGEFVAIVGENGSGKTTLVKHFNRLLSPTSGDVIVNGKNTKECSIATLAHDVGLVFQNPDHMFFADTVQEEIAFGVKNLSISNSDTVINEALEDVGLSGSAPLYPRWLSRGERQRLGIACIIAMQPSVIVLDEPTTGLDGNEAFLVIDILKKLQKNGHTIIIITHNRDIAEHCADRIVTMENGHILSDTGGA
jgi:energy-coupling factor transport system ATP-binding protein